MLTFYTIYHFFAEFANNSSFGFEDYDDNNIDNTRGYVGQQDVNLNDKGIQIFFTMCAPMSILLAHFRYTFIDPLAVIFNANITNNIESITHQY